MLYRHLFIWFWIILSFIVFSGFLIFRVSGYIINFKAKRIEKTAIITISSDPKDASVYLNGKLQGETTAKFTYLRPGLYNFRVEKKGYTVWEKTVRLDPDRFLKEEAVLFLANPTIQDAKPEELDIISKQPPNVDLNDASLAELPKNIFDIQYNKDKKNLLYRAGNEIWLYFLDNPKSEKNKIIARFSKTLQKVAFYPDAEHILFVIDGKLRIIETTGTNDTQLLDLPSTDFWVSSSGREIFFKDGITVKKAKIR